MTTCIAASAALHNMQRSHTTHSQGQGSSSHPTHSGEPYSVEMHSVPSAQNNQKQQSRAAHAAWQKRKAEHSSLPGEEWRPVPSFPGYEASTKGRVRSAHLILQSTPNRHGYLMACPSVGGRQKPIGQHRMVAEAFHGPCPPKMECRHLDGNRLNNRPDNLRWGTRRENQLDRIAHGTTNHGEANGKATITEAQAREVGELLRRGFRSRDVVKLTGVSEGVISMIKMGRTWSHVTGIPKTVDPKRLHRRASSITFLTRDQTLSGNAEEGEAQ